ncbi:MAG TPA: dienelactone hydrolase family protein [Anaerolineae bacterium]
MSEILQQGYLALPSTGQTCPAVMVIHAWWGLNGFFKQLCDRLAQAGFVAFAPDLYDGKVAKTIEQATAYRDQTDWEKANALLRNAVEMLRHHPRTVDQPIGVIGFSLGAYAALSLLEDMPQDVRAAVIFYGTREGSYQGLQASVLGHFAEIDEYEDQSEVDKLEKTLKTAGVDTIFYTYPGTGHWFFESNQPNAYKADAAQLAWDRTVGFLRERLQFGD